MLEEMIEYDLSPDSPIVDHDALCVAQSGRLLEVGYLEYEVAAYGIAIYRNEQIHYYISEHEAMIHEIVKEGLLKNEYSTPVRYYFKRYDLLHKTKEEILQEFYLYIANVLLDLILFLSLQTKKLYHLIHKFLFEYGQGLDIFSIMPDLFYKFPKV